MGKEFGNLQKLWGVNFYYLSPNELKPFAGMFNPGILNTFRRIRSNIFVMGIPFTLTYLSREFALELHHQASRKNPDDYKDDE